MLTPCELTFVPVSEQARYSEAVRQTVARVLAERVAKKYEDIAPISDDIRIALTPWTPVHPEEGKMSKRIAKVMYKEFGVTISDKAVDGLTNYLGADTPAGGFIYDICDTFDWQEGEFGDANTCFYGHNDLLTFMREDGVRALRFFSGTMSNPKGAARAWVWNHPVLNTTWPLVFNAYGLSLQQFASRVKAITDYKTDVSTHYAIYDKHGLTVNLAAALQVRPLATPPPPDMVSVTVNMSHDRDVTCRRCGGQESYKYTRGESDNATSRICRKCWQKDTAVCYWTEQRYPEDELTDQLFTGTINEDGKRTAELVARRVHPSNLYRIPLCIKCHHFIAHESVEVRYVAGLRRNICHLCAVASGLTLVCKRCGGLKNPKEKKCGCQE